MAKKPSAVTKTPRDPNMDGMATPKGPEPVTTAPAKEALVKSYKDFNLKRDIAGKTTTYPFIYPGVGDTGYSLQVRSMHCEEFRQAGAKAARQLSALQLAAAGGEVDEELREDINLRAFCKLVDSWTFPDELNDDALIEFFADNPFVYDDINHLAATDSLFLSKPANS